MEAMADSEQNIDDKTKDRVVVFIVGTTGSGKSKLAVDLALELEKSRGLQCEIINSDVMQMFQGLDIITNKVTQPEMCGIPHHLLAFLGPEVSTFYVTKFRDLALPIIEDILQRGKLPVVVGGSNYYVESLLFENLVDDDDDAILESETATELTSGDGVHIVAQPSPWDGLTEKSDRCEVERAYKALQEVDPVMAEQLHPNNARKIKRALEFHHHTGVALSAKLAEQPKYQMRYPRHAMLYLDAERECLNQRLDRRVDNMVQKGLLPEIELFYKTHSDRISSVPNTSSEAVAGVDNTGPSDASPTALPDNILTDFTRGILQSIGFKEFYPYLALLEDVMSGDRDAKQATDAATREDILSKCIENLKVHTRRYANRQRQWVRNRFAIHHHVHLFSLDSTGVLEGAEPEAWCTQVLHPAHFIVSDLLANADIVALHASRLFHVPRQVIPSANQHHHCADCERDIHGTAQWEAHLKSRAHKKKREWLKKKDTIEFYKRRRLEAAGQVAEKEAAEEKSTLL